jgi:hypothetical protein
VSLPNDPPPLSPPPKPKITAEERRRRDVEWLTLIRLRMAIWRALGDRGTTTPAEIGVALGMPPAEATKLLTGINGAKAMSRSSRPRRPGWGCRCRYRTRDACEPGPQPDIAG